MKWCGNGSHMSLMIDPYQIIILFFIYIDSFKVEKISGNILQGRFNDRSQFGRLGFETFSIHFEELNGIFGLNISQQYLIPYDAILHIGTFPTMQKSCQLYLVYKIYVSFKLTFHVDHHGMEICHIIPHYSCIWGQTHEEFQEYSRRSKTLSKLTVKEVKTLTVDHY